MVACQKIQLTPINGRTVRLIGDFSVCTTSETDGRVSSVIFDFDDGPCVISEGDTITIGTKARFKVNIIREIRSSNGTLSHYDLLTADLNTSSIMAMPRAASAPSRTPMRKLFRNGAIRSCRSGRFSIPIRTG